MQSKPLTVETIEQALSSGAKSLTDIARHLGHKGSISGKLAKQIRELVPDITDRLKANAPQKNAEPKAEKSVQKTKGSVKYPRHSLNPFREGSSYALAFDVLASHPKGIARALGSGVRS